MQIRRISYLFSLSILINFSFAQNYKDSYLQGMQAIKFEKYDLAIEKFKESIKFNPQYPDAWFYLGKTYDHLNKVEETISAYRNLEKVKADYNIAIYYDIAKSY
ncbi:MAG: tetratricopeptide repeat protein, partial [Ekhidna sp.]